MAEWRAVAKAAILAGNNHIDTREVNILREAFFATGGHISRSEIDFLQELRNESVSAVKIFDDLFVDVVKAHMLADGVIDDKEAKWLQEAIFADGEIDELEKRVLDTLKTEAKSTSPSFDTLYADVMK